VLWADVSGNGGEDPLVVTSDATLVHLLPCGDGCYTRGEAVPLGSGGGNATVVSADFNGDTIADVVTASGAGVKVYFGGRASGTRPAGLAATDSATVSTAPAEDVVAADLDGDDDADVGFAGPSLGVALGDAHGAFAAPSFVACYCTSGSMLRGLTVGDFDDDGASEVAALVEVAGPTGPGGRIDVWPFAPGTTAYNSTAGGYLNRLIVAGDVNEDGRDDLVLGVDEVPGFLTGAEISVLHSTGTGFTSGAGVTADGYVGAIAVRDADADGHIDLFAIDTTHDRLEWFPGTGTKFVDPENAAFWHDAGPDPSRLAFGIRAGTTKSDVIISNPTAASARVTYLRS
jgi:hypothetical protein